MKMYALATIHGVSPVAKPTPQIVKSDVSSKIAAQTNCLNLMNKEGSNLIAYNMIYEHSFFPKHMNQINKLI